MKKKNGINSFKVKAFDGKGKVVAEYLFASMKEAIKFECHMRNQKYKTLMERILV